MAPGGRVASSLGPNRRTTPESPGCSRRRGGARAVAAAHGVPAQLRFADAVAFRALLASAGAWRDRGHPRRGRPGRRPARPGRRAGSASRRGSPPSWRRRAARARRSSPASSRTWRGPGHGPGAPAARRGLPRHRARAARDRDRIAAGAVTGPRAREEQRAETAEGGEMRGWLRGLRGSGWALRPRRAAGERGAGCRAGSGEAAAKPFVFTGIPDQDESRLVERFGRVATYLEGKLGVPVRYIPVKNYPAAVTAFTNGQVQLAWFGGFTGCAGAACGAAQPSHRAGRRGRRLQDLLHRQRRGRPRQGRRLPQGHRGQDLHFGSRASTRAADARILYPAGLSGPHARAGLRAGRLSGDHSRTIQLVQSGAFAVARSTTRSGNST